jgi:hypothetical protein
MKKYYSLSLDNVDVTNAWRPYDRLKDAIGIILDKAEEENLDIRSLNLAVFNPTDVPMDVTYIRISGEVNTDARSEESTVRIPGV